MLIKIITCIVHDNSKEIFHHAQTKWAQLHGVNGFIAQAGGWNIFKKNEAVIIAVWETLEKYNLFMSEIHDQIITRNEQTSSYENIEVSLWKTDTDIKYNEILDYKYLVLEHTENHNLIHDKTGDNYVCMSHYKNEEESRVLSFRNELGEVIHSGDVFIRMDCK